MCSVIAVFYRAACMGFASGFRSGFYWLRPPFVVYFLRTSGELVAPQSKKGFDLRFRSRLNHSRYSEDWPLPLGGGHFFVTSITPKMTTANNVRSSRTSVKVIRHHLPSVCLSGRFGEPFALACLDTNILLPVCQVLFQNISWWVFSPPFPPLLLLFKI